MHTFGDKRKYLINGLIRSDWVGREQDFCRSNSLSLACIHTQESNPERAECIASVDGCPRKRTGERRPTRIPSRHTLGILEEPVGREINVGSGEIRPRLAKYNLSCCTSRNQSDGDGHSLKPRVTFSGLVKRMRDRPGAAGGGFRFRFGALLLPRLICFGSLSNENFLPADTSNTVLLFPNFRKRWSFRKTVARLTGKVMTGPLARHEPRARADGDPERIVPEGSRTRLVRHRLGSDRMQIVLRTGCKARRAPGSPFRKTST